MDFFFFLVINSLQKYWSSGSRVSANNLIILYPWIETMCWINLVIDNQHIISSTPHLFRSRSLTRLPQITFSSIVWCPSVQCAGDISSPPWSAGANLHGQGRSIYFSMLLSSVKFLLYTLYIISNKGQKTLQNYVLLKKELSLNYRQLRDRYSVTSIFRNPFPRKKRQLFQLLVICTLCACIF